MKTQLYEMYKKSGVVRSAYHLSHPRTWRPGMLRAATRLQKPTTPEDHLREAMAWMCRAQNAAQNGGVSAVYTVRGGWDAPYPETTGYIICTFLDYAERTGDDTYRQRALRMADWEIKIQRPDGGFAGHPLHGEDQPPIVFDVGQILQGLVRAHAATGDDGYLQAARCAGDWLVRTQEADGSWRRHEYRDTPHVYNARVAWPLASLHEATGDARYADAARRFGDWALAQQHDNGWFDHCAFAPDEPPLTHTIAYTLEGILELGVTLGEARFVDAARRGAHAILDRYEAGPRWSRAPEGLIPGRLDAAWESEDRWACLTGCAQIALTWLRLWEEGNDERAARGAFRLLDALRRVHPVDAPVPEIRGALAGSHPVWGGYIAWGFPNWAPKFFADALLHEVDARARLRTPG